MYIHERRYVISGRQRDPQTEGGSFTARNCSPTEMIAGNDAAATSETHEAHPSQGEPIPDFDRNEVVQHRVLYNLGTVMM
ncbi:uncharacterized protein LOC114246617 isoform X3 [Bombyx mandarina]|uniref:Uncharacterized protein LOC114246617 isoform X3 n=1 Tax=Bombyx mandarina TaxID=7092 RepID=A0A6J2K048_BOMMA|nr:uncharacterized protein LOC114246617 isoform X3 [Bombyx mandarina]